MAKQIYVNIPVSDLERSVSFYSALGFTKVDAFSNEQAAAMQWSNEILLMLVTHNFYAQFLREQTIADVTKTNGVLLCLTFDTKEEVRSFAETAKSNGGDCYTVNLGMPEDMMYGFEVLDPDGNHWEPVWLASTNPNDAA